MADRTGSLAHGDSDQADALRLARALYAAYNAHSGESAANLYDPAATHTEVASGRQASGRGEVICGLAGFFALFPDAHWEPERHIVDGDEVAVQYRLTGTLQTPLGALPAQCQRLELRGVQVIHTRGPWITATEDYWDRSTFHAQMSGNTSGVV